MLCGDRAGGERFTGGLLWRCWLHEYRRLRQVARDLGAGDEELAINARELRGMGHTVAEIAGALKIPQAEAIRLTTT